MVKMVIGLGNYMVNKKSYGPDDVKINRNVKVPLYPFVHMFEGFDKVGAVRKLFGSRTKTVLSRLKVMVFAGSWGYLWIDDKTKSIVCNINYIKSADRRYVYLDVIHELVHIRQSFEGKNLFDDRYEYVDSPTEIEAYKVCVEEAERIGMKKSEIIEYLKVDWVDNNDFKRLLKVVGLVTERD